MAYNRIRGSTEWASFVAIDRHDTSPMFFSVRLLAVGCVEHTRYKMRMRLLAV
jgi:hypothetical protein